MRVQPIIDRLKASAPTLSGRVAGAAGFNDAVEKSELTLPCAFVFRVGGEGAEGAAIGAVVQVITETFAVVVAVDNSADQRGQAGAEAIDPVFEDVIEALVGWAPDSDHNLLEYAGDNHVGMNRARLWHQILVSTSSAFSSVG